MCVCVCVCVPNLQLELEVSTRTEIFLHRRYLSAVDLKKEQVSYWNILMSIVKQMLYSVHDAEEG